MHRYLVIIGMVVFVAAVSLNFASKVAPAVDVEAAPGPYWSKADENRTVLREREREYDDRPLATQLAELVSDYESNRLATLRRELIANMESKARNGLRSVKFDTRTFKLPDDDQAALRDYFKQQGLRVVYSCSTLELYW